MEEFILPALSLLTITGMIFIPLQHLQMKTEREDFRELQKTCLRITSMGWLLIVDSKRPFDNLYVQQLTGKSTIPRRVLLNMMDLSDFEEARKVRKWFRLSNDKKLLKKTDPFWYHLPSSLAIEFDSQMTSDINSKNLLKVTEKSLQNVLQLFEKNNLVKKNHISDGNEDIDFGESENENESESESESESGSEKNEIDSDF